MNIFQHNFNELFENITIINFTMVYVDNDKDTTVSQLYWKQQVIKFISNRKSFYENFGRYEFTIIFILFILYIVLNDWRIVNASDIT